MTVMFLAAAVIVTPAMVELVDDVRQALKRADISEESAAITIGSSHSHLSKQLNGREPFTLWWRFANLSQEFWAEFCVLRAKRRGIPVMTSHEMKDLLGKLDAMIQDFRHDRMARMALPGMSQQEKSA